MKNLNKLIFLVQAFVFYMVFTPYVFSSGSLQLNEKKAVELALTHSEEIVIQNQNIEKFNSAYKKAHAGTYPQLSSRINWNRYIESPSMEFGGVSVPLKEDWEFTAGLQVTQLVWAFGKVSNALEIAQQSKEIQEVSRAVVKTEICEGVKKLYYSFIFASRALKIMEESLQNALENRKALKDRYSAGRIPRATNVKMDADVAARKPSVLSSRSSLNSIRIKLADMLGVDTSTEISVTEGLREDFPVYNKDEFLKEIKLYNPALEVYRKNILLNEHFIKLKRSDYYPTISSFLSYNYTGNGNDMYPSGDMHNEIIGGLVMGVNLWDSGARKNAIKETSNEYNIAKLKYEQQLKKIEVQLDTLLEGYQSLQESYQSYLKAEGLAKDAYDITFSAFRSGGISQSLLNDAEMAYTGAKLGSLKTLYDINMKIIEIDALKGEGRDL